MRETNTGALWCGASAGVFSGLGFLVCAAVASAAHTGLRRLASWLDAGPKRDVEAAYRICTAGGGAARITLPFRAGADATTARGAARRDSEQAFRPERAEQIQSTLCGGRAEREGERNGR